MPTDRIKFWSGEKLSWSAESPVAVDTETEVLYDEAGEMLPLAFFNPRLALASVSDGIQSFILRPESAADFFLAHIDAHFGFFNAGFDFWVFQRHFETCPEAAQILWDAAEENRLLDGCLLDQLVRLAQGDIVKGNQKGESLIPRNLEEAAKAWDSPLIPDKNCPYRIRYGELLALPSWDEVADDWFDYALTDAIATWHVVKNSLARARILSSKYSKHFYPGAVELHGPLTANLQVRGAIALRKMGFTGIYFDPERVRTLEESYRREFNDELAFFEQEFPDFFFRYKKKNDGGYAYTAKSKVPKMYKKKQIEVLSTIAQKYSLKIPVSPKTKQLSTRFDHWSEYHHLDQFLAHWAKLNKLSKILGFFDAFWTKSHNGRLKPAYGELKKTGRTGSTSPNMQNRPKADGFRACFISPPGKKLMTVDFSFVELRTLASVCFHTMGRSELASTIQGGKDPHTYTASMITGIPYDEIKRRLKLPKDDPLRKEAANFRQSSKACFHPDVQLLTPEGWKRVADITTLDKVAQYDPTDKSVQFVNPLAIITVGDQPILKVESRHSYLRVTPDHRMYCLNWADRPLVCTPEELPIKARRTVHAGYLSRKGSSDQIAVRRAVCIQADGSWRNDRRECIFGFKKDRKIRRFRELFTGLIKREFVTTNGATHFVVQNDSSWMQYLIADKTYNTEKLLSESEEIREAFLNELYYWDGSHKTSSRCFSVTTVKTRVVDAIQAVAAITGRRTVVCKWIPNLSEFPAYSISIVETDNAKPSKLTTKETAWRGTVHCVSVPSSFILTRDKYRVQVSGNCNFGVPGGLGPAKLVASAKNTYKVEMTEQQAAAFRNRLTEDVYPELSYRTGYMADRRWESLLRNLELDPSVVISYFRAKRFPPSAILSSMDFTLSGLGERPDPRAWIVGYDLASMSPRATPRLLERLKNQEPGPSVSRFFFKEVCVVPTGRIWADVRYTQARNGPFQGLAADGGKIALWQLLRAGFSVVAFIHDEMIIELPDALSDSAPPTIEKILNSSMEIALNHLVPSAVEYHVGDCWEK